MLLSITAGLDGLSIWERMILLGLATAFAGVVAVAETRRFHGRRSPSIRAVAPRTTGSELFQLPRDINDYVGHQDEIDLVVDFLRASAGYEAVRVTAVAGKVGVGKTAFAIHAAHRLRTSFPDGSLYVDLRGADSVPLDVRDVLAGLLRELGVARPAVPERLEERARLYRARMSGRRMLVILDDATDETQVRPLLPGGPGCSVIVTRREPLVGLADALHLTLDELDRTQSLYLLRSVIGETRVAAELKAANTLVSMCGHLPLAVSIAANKLASRRHWTISTIVDRLRDQKRLLGELSAGDQGIRASIALSYNDLGEAEKRMFRLLGMLDVQDFGAWVGAAMLGVELEAAEVLIDRLVDIQLVVASPNRGGGTYSRFSFHTLLKVFARERLELEESLEARREAMRAALGAYVAITERAYSLAELGDIDQATRPFTRWITTDRDQIDQFIDNVTGWFTSERANVIAVTEQGYHHGFDEEVCRLAISLYGSFNVGAHWHAWHRLYQLALDSARRCGDRRFEAEIMLRLGDVCKNSGRVDGPGGIPEADPEDMLAAGCLERSRAMFQELGDRRVEVAVIRRLGGVYRDLGYLDQARQCYEEALALIANLPGSDLLRAYVMRGYGCLQRTVNQYDEAVRSYLSTMDTFRGIADPRGMLGTLRGLGATYLKMSRWDEAETCFRQHLSMVRDLGDRHAEAHMQHGLGEVALGKLEYRSAISHFLQCLPTFTELEHRNSEAEALTNLGTALLALGRRKQACEAWERARSLYRLLMMAPKADQMSERINGARRVTSWRLIARAMTN